MMLSDLNYLAILAAGAVKFALGGVWYSLLFQKPWLAELKWTPEEIAAARTEGGKSPLVITFFVGFIQVVALAVVLRAINSDCVGCAVGTAAMLSLAFAAVPIGINYLFERRSLRFWLVNAGYDLVGMVLAGLVLGLWAK